MAIFCSSSTSTAVFWPMDQYCSSFLSSWFRSYSCQYYFKFLNLTYSQLKLSICCYSSSNWALSFLQSSRILSITATHFLNIPVIYYHRAHIQIWMVKCINIVASNIHSFQVDYRQQYFNHKKTHIKTKIRANYNNQMSNIRRSLEQCTRKFNLIMQRVFDDYEHQEDFYESAHEIMETIKYFIQDSVSEVESAILTLGKTGWGKSTLINYLDGVKLIPNQYGHLVISPDNDQPIKTEISDGESNKSTTMVPRFCRTIIGNVCDLPGDEDTGGPLAEIINSIAKKNVGKSVKKVKIILMIPETVLGPEGNYGRGLKDILESNDKFLKGINKFRDNIMIVISFASRRSTLQSIYQKINGCLEHEDRVLETYRGLLTEVMNQGRVKLFPKPSDSQSIYSFPEGQAWKPHYREQIIREILKLPSRDCSQSDFSVPENSKTLLMLKKFRKVILEKIKYTIEANYDQIVLSGIQLSFAKNVFASLKQKNTLQKFLSIYDRTSFLPDKKPELTQLNKELKFISQFVLGSKQPQAKENWISRGLDKRINRVVDNIQMLSAQRGGSFRHQFENQLLKVRPNSEKFQDIKLEFGELKNLEALKQRIDRDKRDNESEFYEEYKQKVYDKTINVPQEFQESYVDIEKQQKRVQVPKNVEYDMPIKRDRVLFKDEVEKYRQNVPKVRTVTKTMTVPITTTGGRRYLIAGPRQKYHTSCTFSYDTQQIYYQQQQKSRNVSKAYTEEYTDYIKANRVQFEQKMEQQNVPVEKSRMRTVQIQKDVYKQKDLKRFNDAKFEQTDAEVIQNISAERTIIKDMINQASGDMREEIEMPEENVVSCQIEENYRDLLQDWRASEYQAFARKYPNLSINVQQMEQEN